MDILGELKVSTLLGFLEQAAIEASADAGFDPERYASLKGVWLVRRTLLEKFSPVGGGDQLSISTHIADLRRARSLRNYEVSRKSGYGNRLPALAARATTDWVYCNVDRGRPATVPDEMKHGLFGGTGGERRKRPPAVEMPPEPEAASFAARVQPSHLDHMSHVNNAVWADFLEDAGLALFAERGFGIPEMLERGGALRIRALDVEYLDNAGIGEEIVVRTWLEEPDWRAGEVPNLRQVIEGPDGRRLARARTEWVWRNRPQTLGGIPDDPV